MNWLELRSDFETCLQRGRSRWAAGDSHSRSLDQWQADEIAQYLAERFGGAGESREIYVGGHPVSYAKGRATVSVAPKRLKAWKELVQWTWIESHGNFKFIGPVSVDISFWTNLSRQDGDNMMKAVLDALKNVAFEDDEYVYDAHWRKAPSERDDQGAEIRVSEYRGTVNSRHRR